MSLVTKDLWVFTSENRQPAVSLPVELPMGMGPDGGDTAVAEKAPFSAGEEDYCVDMLQSKF